MRILFAPFRPPINSGIGSYISDSDCFTSRWCRDVYVYQWIHLVTLFRPPLRLCDILQLTNESVCLRYHLSFSLRRTVWSNAFPWKPQSRLHKDDSQKSAVPRRWLLYFQAAQQSLCRGVRKSLTKKEQKVSLTITKENLQIYWWDTPPLEERSPEHNPAPKISTSWQKAFREASFVEPNWPPNPKMALNRLTFRTAGIWDVRNWGVDVECLETIS